MSKFALDPENALKLIQALWPWVESVEVYQDGWVATGSESRQIFGTAANPIDWPEGVTKWPLKWRKATIQDFVEQRKARFSDDKENWTNTDSTISGYTRQTGNWQRGGVGDWWTYAEVPDIGEESQAREIDDRFGHILNLQLAIEYHANGMPVPQEIVDKIPNHSKMLNDCLLNKTRLLRTGP